MLSHLEPNIRYKVTKTGYKRQNGCKKQKYNTFAQNTTIYF